MLATLPRWVTWFAVIAVAVSGVPVDEDGHPPRSATRNDDGQETVALLSNAVWVQDAVGYATLMKTCLTELLPLWVRWNVFGTPISNARRHLPTVATSPESPPHLVILIHGLLSHPSHLEHFAESIVDLPNRILWFPFVHRRGIASLNEALMESIWPALQKQWSVWSNASITIVGHSNGGRLAAALDVLLRLHGHKGSRHLHLICPVLGGTQFAHLLMTLTRPVHEYAPKFLTDLGREMSPGSDTARVLGSAFCSVPGHRPTRAFVYRTRLDLMVYPMSLIDDLCQVADSSVVEIALDDDFEAHGHLSMHINDRVVRAVTASRMRNRTRYSPVDVRLRQRGRTHPDRGTDWSRSLTKVREWPFWCCRGCRMTTGARGALGVRRAVSSRVDPWAATSSIYAQYRPTYPAALVEYVLEHAGRRRRLAVDIGCGSGQLLGHIAPHYERVVGNDLSGAQLSEARKKFPGVTFIEGDASAALSKMEPNSVDLVTMAQALHWITNDSSATCNLFREIRRVLMDDGLFAVIGYAVCRPQHNGLRRVFAQFYEETFHLWDARADRRILDRGMQPLNLYGELAAIEHRWFYDRRSMPLDTFLKYVATWSMLAKRPELLAEFEGRVDSMRPALSRDDLIKIEFPFFCLLLSKPT
ncbi:Methyltransferase domain [Plasmodiophora brassicae]